MNKAVKIRYYIESLCVYDFKQDEIIGALYDLLNSLDSEAVLIKQSRFFNLISSHHSFRHYVSKLILTDDNVFTKAAAAGKCDELDPAVIDGVKSDLQKALQRLPERERVLMVLYYQENMTMKEIGETLNMSESRVCQLHAQAIMKLKNIFSENRTSRLQQAIV